MVLPSRAGREMCCADPAMGHRQHPAFCLQGISVEPDHETVGDALITPIDAGHRLESPTLSNESRQARPISWEFIVSSRAEKTSSPTEFNPPIAASC